MKKWVALPVLLVLLLAGYVAAGPFLTVNRIRDAVAAQDMPALAREVDFPAVRASLKAQIEDTIARRAGPDAQASPFGAIALRIASGMAGGAVDALATPAGVGLILQGRSVWERAAGAGSGGDPFRRPAPADPLEQAEYRFESASRFTATVHDADGEPVVFVLTRDGLHWRLTDIRLPLNPQASQAGGR